MTTIDSTMRAAVMALRGELWGEAELRSRRVLREEPTRAQALYVLACVQARIGNPAESIYLLEDAIHAEPGFIPAYRLLSADYYALKRAKDSISLYRKWVEQEPTSPEPAHMLAATMGLNMLSRCSTEYLISHFNRFAPTFDQVLSALRYRGPELMRNALAECVKAKAGALKVLDAGCGTGMCGPAVQPYAQTLTGVDIASKMLDRARDYRCYDELIEAELSEFLESHDNRYDAIVCCDLLPYYGDLRGLASLLASRLQPHGTLIATAERLLDSIPRDYFLQPSGRFSHHESYLRRVFTRNNLEIGSLDVQFMRHECGEKIDCYVMTAASTA